MDNQNFETAPKDLLDQIEKLIRRLSKKEQFDLYKGLKAGIGDLRKSNRKTFFSEIVFTSLRGAHHEFIKDISEDGVFIETPIPFQVGEKLSLTFPIKSHSEHIKLSGEIIRKTEIGIGVKFHPVDRSKASLLKNHLEAL